MQNHTTDRFRICLSIFLAVAIFICLYFISTLFFTSSFINNFIWNVNTFRGLFKPVYEVTALNVEDEMAWYAVAFHDFYSHLPRSVGQNEAYYSFLVALFGSVGTFIFCIKTKSEKRLQQIRCNYLFLLIIVAGLGARLFLAYHTTCNRDGVSWHVLRYLLDRGQNIYSIERFAANYPPLWFWIVQLIGKLKDLLLPAFHFLFVVRALLSFVDLVTLVFLIKIAKTNNVSPIKTAALFFLNPISVIITGYHGQCEPLLILLMVLSIYFADQANRQKAHWSWLLMTVAVAIKHVVVNQLIVLLDYVKELRKKFIWLLCLSFILIIFLFIPFLNNVGGVVRNVVGYGGVDRFYGFNALFEPPVKMIYKYIFIVLLFLWAYLVKTTSLGRRYLLSFLFYLVFTPGISAQQFVLPIALGALIPSSGFYLYSIAGSLFLFGDYDELKIRFFTLINWNIVWFSVLFWFLTELRHASLKENQMSA